MEYALSPKFKAYAGGLGILAGDYLKGAKDYGYPVIGVGIKWKQGYTDQRIDENGRPYDTYHNYDYSDFLEDTGVEVTVEISQETVKCKVWKLEAFGNNPVYLLDTDLPENPAAWTTGQLYGWFGEERVAQEIVLGIGGVKALRALGIAPDVFHFNEGHALFAGFELVREKMATGLSYKKAFKATRQQVVFTTHTPVVQGNESHPLRRLLYMGADNGLGEKRLKKLGGEPFNMTVAALRLAKKANAVADLHRKTANKMWKKVKKRAEIVGVTNAIHRPTWVDSRMLEAAENGGDLWELHMDNKRKLIAFVKERTGVELKEDSLLIGFARRAVAYKRSTFLFYDESKVEKLLQEGRLQLVYSGKAHPLDDNGKDIVAGMVAKARQYPESVVYLQNYDMDIGQALTRGSDIWLNNPRRPKEASGTSGMKAAMNGVLNLSILDGWWPEICQHGVNGWQFGDGYENRNTEKQDSNDAKSFYKVLLGEVLPAWYEDREKWLKMMKASIIDTKESFDMKRMLEEYYTRLYSGK